MTKTKTTRDAYYFAFGAKDWRSSESVRLMSAAERGCFVDLLAIAWLSSDEPCSIPAGDAELASLLGLPVEEWQRYAPRVLAEFDVTTDGNRLRNEKLWSEYKRMRTEHRQRAKGGRTSALRARDAHGRLLPRVHQESTKTLSASQSQSQSQLTTTTQSRTTTSAIAVSERPERTSWLTPSCAVWESRFGAGSFPAGEAAGQLKGLKKAGHSPDKIARHLDRYLEQADPQYLNLSRFSKTFDTWGPVKLSGPPIVDGLPSDELIRLSTPDRARLAS